MRPNNLRSVHIYTRVYYKICPICGHTIKNPEMITRGYCEKDNCKGYCTIESNVEVEGYGYFHTWGVNYDEFENGPGNYTVAIVERENGKVEEILPKFIEFM